jgi:putative ABC transport system ATP-binding protein
MLGDVSLREAFAFVDVVFERDGRRLLDHVSDHIHAGATTALIGDSGSGKSTFLRLLNRFAEPTSGTITFDGIPLADHDVHALRRRVGLVAQRPTMLTDRVDTELRVGGAPLSDSASDDLLTRVGLEHLAMDPYPVASNSASRWRGPWP